jgi:hypothetical protein
MLNELKFSIVVSQLKLDRFKGGGTPERGRSHLTSLQKAFKRHFLGDRTKANYTTYSN